QCFPLACGALWPLRLAHNAVFLSDVRLPSGVVYRDDPGGHREVREQLVSYSIRLLDDGLAVATAPNMTSPAAAQVLITPSGISYRDMLPDDVCVVGLDGSPRGQRQEPSSETPMHLAVYASTPAGAVVHTHSPEVVALSAVCDELPAIHYAIVGLGGPVRVVRYTRFGSDDLAQAAAAALEGRFAAILGSHGAICYGATLEQAYDRALLLEWLAHDHRLDCAP